MSIIRFNSEHPLNLQKFTSFEKFKSILGSKKLYVARVDKFSDEQEGLLPKDLFSDDNVFQLWYDSEAKYTYVSCFTYENEHPKFMFKEYTGAGDNEDYSNSLFFIINREGFEKAVHTSHKVCSGLVNYYKVFSTSVHVSAMKPFEVYFSKQEEGLENNGEKKVQYLKEKEYRYVFQELGTTEYVFSSQEPTLDEIWAEPVELIKEDKNIEVELDDLSFIERVCLHPGFSEGNEQQLRELISQAGLNISIERLSL